ncbi:MAG: carbohydrate binding family 9 domain-containing protein [Bacteroidota bacterium]|nr:carbohydrate binding family 9 domain-containing protein [Bacteroidota bacterium]
MNRLVPVLLALVFLSLEGSVVLSQVASVSADTTYHPNIKPTLNVKRRAGDIKIDGNLDDAGWQNAEIAGGFCSSFPVPGMKPKECTYAKITYDNDYLYIAMIAEDHSPKEIRSSYSARDHIWSDDFMGIILDTYGDGSRAFEIYANPCGVQGDLFWTPTTEDESYDLVYESEGKITDSGWQLEMKIPFRSLRFPDIAVQNFHCSFWRSFPRDRLYKYSWAEVNFFVPCPFCQFGSLSGIENIHPAGSFELLPAIVASQNAESDGNGGHLINSSVKVSPSLGARYVLGTATGVEIALNPDFSQVESDAAQISANTTFALFYPEHRPFFQDGADLLNMDLSAVYTRSINSPIIAAKAIHRDAALSVAYLGAVDEHSPVIIPLEERSIVLSDVGRSISNMARATYSFGNNSKIGGLVTNRTFSGDGSNTVAGLDGRLHLFENVEMAALALMSYTQEAGIMKNGDSGLFNGGRHTVEFDGERFSGYADHIYVGRHTNGLDIELAYDELSPAFRAANGFIFQNDSRAFSAWTGYKFPFEEASWLKEFDMSVGGDLRRNFEGAQKFISIRPELDFSLPAQTNFHILYRHSKERFHGLDFANINLVNCWAGSHPLSWADLSCSVTYGNNIARALDIPVIARELDVYVSASFRILGSLTVAPEYSFSKLDSIDKDGPPYFSGAIYRTKVSYQFSREISARLIVQYDEFTSALEIDPLFTYQLNPFTSLFVGSSHNYQSIDNPSRLMPSERQFFAKIQYLLQG